VTIQTRPPAISALAIEGKIGGMTNAPRPRLTGSTAAKAIVELIDVNGQVLGLASADASGNFTIQPTTSLAEGVHTLRARVRDLAGNIGTGQPLTLTIDTVKPNPPSVALAGLDDSGIRGDGVTNVRRPRLLGSTEPGATVQLLNQANQVLATATGGLFTLQPGANLPAGRNALSVRAIDAAGNVGPAAPLVLTITGPSGDYDGDGKADLAVYRPSQALWILHYSGGGMLVTAMGDPSQGDIAAPGDYDGDGKTDLAVYRPSQALWIERLSGGGVISTTFGAPGRDKPVPADYDGDGKTDLAVYRPSQALWIERYSSGGTNVVDFGDRNADDIAVEASPYYMIRYMATNPHLPLAMTQSLSSGSAPASSSYDVAIPAVSISAIQPIGPGSRFGKFGTNLAG
jgi:hypothetical protein